jgi:hypothetical protein
VCGLNPLILEGGEWPCLLLLFTRLMSQGACFFHSCIRYASKRITSTQIVLRSWTAFWLSCLVLVLYAWELSAAGRLWLRLAKGVVPRSNTHNIVPL